MFGMGNPKQSLGPGISISFPEFAVIWSHVLLPSQLETASLTFEVHTLLVLGSLKTDLTSFQAHDSSLALSLCATFTHIVKNMLYCIN